MLFSFFSDRPRDPQRYLFLSVLQITPPESISDLCFTAAVPRSVRDESPDTPPLQRASLDASPSSSEGVTCCSALRLLLCGEYCSLLHLHTASRRVPP